MSSVIDEEIPEDQDDLEIKSLKAKLAQIPPKYPSDNKKELESLASSLVESFHNQNIKNAHNDSFNIKEASQNYGSDFHNNTQEEENEVYTNKQPQNYQSSDSNIPSKKVLDPNEEKLSSNINISGFLSNQKITSNISFKFERLTKNEENLSSNASNIEFQHNQSSLSNKSANNSKNQSSQDKKENKNLGNDSNLTHLMELSEGARKLSSNLNFSMISKVSDSNISFSLHENLDPTNSNLSFEYSKENQDNINKQSEKPQDIPIDQKRPSIKINKPRPQSSKAIDKEKEKENNESKEKPTKIIKVPKSKPEKPIESKIKPPTQPKKVPHSAKSIKKPESLKKIKEDVEKENEDAKPKSFLIKKMSSKENHKDLVKKIMEDYEKKELSYKEKEADLFVLETMEKKHLNDEDQKKENDDNKDDKKAWNTETKIDKFDINEHKKLVKKTVAETQSKAEKFLLQLQMKMDKKKVNNYVKEDNNNNDNKINKKDNNDEMFEEIKPEEGDQLLPDQKKSKNDVFDEEKENDEAGDQLLPPDLKAENEKEPKQLENSDEVEKPEDKNEEDNPDKNQDEKKEEKQDENVEVDEKKEDKQEQVEEKPEENTWKYPVGDGQKTEYEKTQKVKEKEDKKKTTEIKKTQAENISSKKQKMLEIEKELRKKQKDINSEQKNNAQIAKPIKALEKAKDKQMLDKPANIQNEAKNVEKREIDSQSMRSFKAELNELIRQNKELKSALKSVLIDKSTIDNKIEEMKKNQKVVSLPNGKFTSFGLVPSVDDSKISTKDNSMEKSEANSQNVSQNMSINSEERNKALDLSVIGRIVNKIALGGLTLTQVFELLDYDGDKILTMNEISTNIPKLNLNLTKEEVKELLKQLDSNTDGVINKEEFINCLEKPFEIEQEYYQIMGNIKDIDNPMIMEERKMDMNLRKRLVLEEIAKQEKEYQKNQTDYKKIVKKLNKYEQIFNKSNRNTEQQKNEAKKNLTSLQIIVGELERKLDKLECGYNDKLKEIDDNLKFLQKELIIKAEKVLEAKDLLEIQKNLYQKLQIKQLTYEKISAKVKKDLELINENELQLNKHIQENLQIKATRNNGALKQLYFAVNSTYCYIKIQSMFRMKLAKRRFVSIRGRSLAVRILIVGKLHKLLKKCRVNMFNRKIFLCFKPKIDYFFKKLKQFSPDEKKKDEGKEKEKDDDLFQDKEIDKGDQYLPDLSPGLNPNKGTLENIDHSALLPISASKILDKELEDEYLLSALTIQRKLRGRWNAAKRQVAKTELKMGNLEHYCIYCKRFDRGEKEVDRICRKCKDAFFCFSCFENYHKSKGTRNHPYYDVGKNAFDLFENEENLKKITDELCDRLKGEQYDKLEREFLGEDRYHVGLIPQELAEKLLNYVMEIDSGNVVERMVKMLCKVNLEKSEKAAQRFKISNAKFDKFTNYVDYENLMMMLMGAKEQGKENEENTPGIRKEISIEKT